MKVYELLAEPTSWTKGAFARAANGEAVGTDSRNACCWCLGGAINRVYGIAATPIRKQVFSALYDRVGIEIAKWNDAPERTHAEVVALCRELDI